mgnify:CR=1 FL=1
MKECRFCGEALESAGSEIAITLDGETLVSGHICAMCKRAVLRDEHFRGDAIGALIYELDNNLWCEFCQNCPCEEGCEIPFAFNCPSIRKAIAEETE